jgi:hypothetical protein
MEGIARTRFTPKQKTELWERWKNGQCIADIARAWPGQKRGLNRAAKQFAV